MAYRWPAFPWPPADNSCPFNYCLCSWRRECSPWIPRIAPNREYYGVVEDSPARSVLLGVMAGVTVTSLGLHRFRVAHSGRILGRSGETLEIVVDDIDYKAKNTNSSSIRVAAATRSSDGCSLSLCLFSRERDFYSESNKSGTPRPLLLHLDLAAGRRITMSPLPDLPIAPRMPTCPVSVAGELWASYLTGIDGPFDLVMQRLDKDAGNWVEVARFSSPEGIERDRCSNVPILQGVAVVGSTILLSLYPSHLFFTFDCSTLVWKAVITQQMTGFIIPRYIPIHGQGVYVEEDDRIYFLSGHSLYSYKLCLDDQDGQYSMMPPTDVAQVCPFQQGDGFVTHLGGRVMCFVWIGEKFDCDCDTEHVLITTFTIKGDGNYKHFVPKGIHILHSTCRRLDRSPSKHNEPHCEFCFIHREYEEIDHENSRADVKEIEYPTPPPKKHRAVASTTSRTVSVSSRIGIPSSMITCCREFFNGTPFEHAVELESSAIQIDLDLYIVSQTTACSAVYRINILDGKLRCLDTILTPHCTLERQAFIDDEALMNRTRPLLWHFFSDPKFIYAAGHMDNELYSCSLLEGQLRLSTTTRPIGVEFQLVLRVGIKILALTDNLQGVYHLSETSEWICSQTSVPLPYLGRKVKLSGYVVLDTDSFMISDADSNCCFLLNLQHNEWSVVKPRDQRPVKPSQCVLPGRAFLSGRSLFVNGFIYTCTTGGLAAYELVEDSDSCYIGDQIYLMFSWEKNWEAHRMCFEYVGKDINSGSIMFCVLEDYETCVHNYPDNTCPVCITTVQVKTEGMPNGNLKPKIIGHVDIGTLFVECSGSEIWIRNCFAAAPV